MRELFSFAELIAERSGRTVVLKEHPSSRVKYPDLARRVSDRVIFANGNSTQELIEKADCVVTINSTVGLESILLAKPVLVLGRLSMRWKASRPKREVQKRLSRC